MKFSDFILNPYALNLAISSSCEIQSKAFGRSVKLLQNPSNYLTFSKVSRSSVKDSATHSNNSQHATQQKHTQTTHNSVKTQIHNTQLSQNTTNQFTYIHTINYSKFLNVEN